MSIFEFNDYRSYIQARNKSLPNKGRGELSRIAQYLRVNTTLISQIMSGLRELSNEQAYSLSSYFGHTDLERDYFALLIQIARAGTIDLKKHLEIKLDTLKAEALQLTNRIPHKKKLSNSERSIFYSSWIYSAVHLFTSVNEMGVTIDDIAMRFQISKSKAAEIIQFLTTVSLCHENHGRYTMGVQSTFVERGSPHLLRHHANWRIKAIQKSEALTESEMMYTGQFSLSRQDFEILREQFAEMLAKTNKVVKDSRPDEIACLHLDWFWIN